jgi:hypothetical protein
MNLAGIFLGSFLAAIIFLVIMFIKDNSEVEETRNRMRAECSNEKCPKLQVVKPTEASPENLEWAKRRKEVAASIDAELMRRFKRAACGGDNFSRARNSEDVWVNITPVM